MRKIDLNSEFILHYLLCLIVSSVAVSFMGIALLKPLSFLAFWSVGIISFFAFFFYLFFASPIQYKLNKKPRKFSLVYLMIYVVFSFLFMLIPAYDSASNPFVTSNYYVMASLAAIVFWIADSIFLQKKEFLI
ncbi:UPF0715 family protein [Peribacillus sp. NPDC097197]|uniref:UPF0715 family protein n=1 Tax=Peribacillus sp. NPDC097197 TaxID=3390615 RepID=UPI003D078C6D